MRAASLPREFVDLPDPVSDRRSQTVVHLAISQRFRRNGEFVFFPIRLLLSFHFCLLLPLANRVPR